MALQHRDQPRRRGGFTLIETIVTVGLIAVLAAFVIPTVIQKAGAGDPVKVQNDLNTVRTGLETYATDSKAGFPHLINNLTAKPTATVSRLIDSTAMTANQVAKWNGPYIAATITSATGDSLATGYTAYIMNFVDRYDLDHNVPEHKADGSVDASFSSTATLFASLELHGLTTAQGLALNKLIDGEGDVSAADTSNTTGRFRFGAPTAGILKAYYLASPITP
jgi:prepilin-type N-terminal cleavage/methylation domain-containing protein